MPAKAATQASLLFQQTCIEIDVQNRISGLAELMVAWVAAFAAMTEE
jgi:hypothetical protein